MGSSPITFVSSGEFDSHRLACAVTNTDAREVKPSGVDTLAHEQGGAVPVLDTTPALAEGTDGVEPAGEAERAKPAQPEALAPWTQGEAGYVHEMSQEDSMTT